MIKLLIFISVFISSEAFAGTCSTTSRTNYTNGQVLASTTLNTDFNQLVSKSNSFDGGCVTDGSLEAAALSSTEFATVTNGIHEGCALTYSDSNTIGVGKCILSSNGNLIKTTIQTNVTWGCTSCSDEASASLYYLYAKPTSVGTTLNLLISTTAPGTDGFDLSAGKVLGKFYNNAANSIDIQSVYNWSSGRYIPAVSRDFTAPAESFSFYFGGANVVTPCTSGVCATLKQSGNFITSIERGVTAGNYTITFARPHTTMWCTGALVLSTGRQAHMIPGGDPSENTNTMDIATSATEAPYSQGDTYGIVSCWGY